MVMIEHDEGGQNNTMMMRMFWILAIEVLQGVQGGEDQKWV